MIAMNHKFSIHKKRVKQLNPSINIIEMRAARNIRQIMACVPVNMLQGHKEGAQYETNDCNGSQIFQT